MTSSRKARLTAFLEAVWNQGDVNAVGDHVAERYTVRHDPGDPWHGQTLDQAGFAERLLTSRSAFPDQRFTVVDMVEEADRVAVSWTWEATHLGDLPGYPASGKTISMSGLTVYDFEGDRLAGHWQSCDRLGVFMQLQANRS